MSCRRRRRQADRQTDGFPSDRQTDIYTNIYIYIHNGIFGRHASRAASILSGRKLFSTTQRIQIESGASPRSSNQLQGTCFPDIQIGVHRFDAILEPCYVLLGSGSGVSLSIKQPHYTQNKTSSLFVAVYFKKCKRSLRCRNQQNMMHLQPIQSSGINRIIGSPRDPLRPQSSPEIPSESNIVFVLASPRHPSTYKTFSEGFSEAVSSEIL